MLVFAWVDHEENISVELVEVDSKDSLEVVMEKIQKVYPFNDCDEEAILWAIIDPASEERVKSIRWPETFGDGEMDRQNDCKFAVYRAFATDPEAIGMRW